MKPILSSATLFSALLFLLLFFSHCYKVTNNAELTASDFMATAKSYVSSIQTQSPVYQAGNPHNDRTSRSRELIWSSATITRFRSRPAVLVPFHFIKEIFIKTTWSGNNNFRLDNQAQLLVYQDSTTSLHAEVVTTLPDTNFLDSDQTRFSGVILVDDWWGNSIYKYHFTSDGRVERYNPNQNADLATTPKKITATKRPDMLIQTCTYIYGYNYAVGAENDGEYWVELVGCTSMYLPETVDAGGGGSSYSGIGGGGTALTSSKIVIKLPPDRPIKNLLDYLKCFTNVGGNDHTYTVTICVDQPVPGNRTAWKLTDGGPLGSSAAGNMVDVGHTFLIFTEQYGGGTITRNVGFYPSGRVTPNNPASPGKLNNDDNHQYNIAATFTVTNANFFIMLLYLQRATDPNFYYNLNSENCTSFALQTLAQGGIFLPSTIGSWPGGTGNNPGDLGEDIRQMTTLPNMTKSTSPVYHFNVGNCQ